jgi:glycosyltransferase involved in cell wall biosynthesis
MVGPSFIQALRSYNPDIIHALDYRHFTTDMATLYSWVGRKPLVITLTGFFYEPTTATRVVMKLYDTTLGRASLKICRSMICLTRSDVRGPIAGVKDKIKLIPTGIRLEEIEENNINAQEFRQRFDLGSGRMILGVGRLVKQKGFQYLIPAFRKINGKFPDCKLVIIGQEADYAQQLKDLAGGTSAILFTGGIPDEWLRLAYRAADVFVIPSLDEGFPRTLLEAMAFGKPIVTTPVGAIPEVIKDHANGILVEPESPDQLADAIIEVLNDPSLSIRLGRAAKTEVAKYDWEVLVHEVVKVYDEAMRASHGSFERACR